MKHKKSLLVLFVAAMLLIPITASAAISAINVSNGVWDNGGPGEGTWGDSLGSSATVNGYYMNVDAFPVVSTYFFGVDLPNPFLSGGAYSVEVSMDCDGGGPGDLQDLFIDFSFGYITPFIFPVSSVVENFGGYSDYDTVSGEIVGAGNQLEMEVPITLQDISACVGSDNTIRIVEINELLFDTGTNGSTPTAVELQNFSAMGNTSSESLLWIAGIALMSIAGVIFLHIRRRKVMKK